MDPTRRQFGLWSSAALLIGPSAALAGKGPKPGQAASPPPPSEQAALSFSVVVKERTSEGLTLDVTVTNTGSEGATLSLRVASFELADASGTRAGFSWVNDENPFSRRVAPPAFVDVGPGRTLLAGVVHLGGWEPEASTAPTAHVQLVADGAAKGVTVPLAPFPVDVAPGTVLTVQQPATPGS